MKTGQVSESLPNQQTCHQMPNGTHLHETTACLAHIGCHFIAYPVMWLLQCVVCNCIDVSHVVICADEDVSVVTSVDVCCVTI